MKKFLIVLFFLLGMAAAPRCMAAGNLAWQDNSDNEDGFRVYRQKRGTTSFVAIGNTGVNVNTFVDPTGFDGDSYYVTAFNSAGESEPSNTATLPIIIRIPAGATGLTVTFQ